jgi:hypothetical protein
MKCNVAVKNKPYAIRAPLASPPGWNALTPTPAMGPRNPSDPGVFWFGSWYNYLRGRGVCEKVFANTASLLSGQKRFWGEPVRPMAYLYFQNSLNRGIRRGLSANGSSLSNASLRDAIAKLDNKAELPAAARFIWLRSLSFHRSEGGYQ